LHNIRIRILYGHTHVLHRIIRIIRLSSSPWTLRPVGFTLQQTALLIYYEYYITMSQPVQDPPLTEMPPSVNAPGPSVAIGIFDDAIEYQVQYFLIKYICFNVAFLEFVCRLARTARLSYTPVHNRPPQSSREQHLGLTCVECIVRIDKSNRLHERQMRPCT
jgi:hypothetical protein